MSEPSTETIQILPGVSVRVHAGKWRLELATLRLGVRLLDWSGEAPQASRAVTVTWPDGSRVQVTSDADARIDLPAPAAGICAVQADGAPWAISAPTILDPELFIDVRLPNVAAGDNEGPAEATAETAPTLHRFAVRLLDWAGDSPLTQNPVAVTWPDGSRTEATSDHLGRVEVTGTSAGTCSIRATGAPWSATAPTILDPELFIDIRLPIDQAAE